MTDPDGVLRLSLATVCRRNRWTFRDGGHGNGRLDESKRLTRREIYVCVFVPGKTVIFRLSVVGQRGSWIWINALRAPALTEAERQKRGSVTPRAS